MCVLFGCGPSYARIQIHEDMIRDEARTESYRDAILQNRHLFEGKVVIDVGCGTGILSMFAVLAGARHVYAMEMSDIADMAVKVWRGARAAHVHGLSDSFAADYRGQRHEQSHHR